MARSLTIEEKLSKARDLIQQARQVPVPPGAGKYDMTYIARVKDLLRQARDTVKFIPMQPIATPEIKAEVNAVLEEADRANQEIFQSKPGS